MLVTKSEFIRDLQKNYGELQRLGISNLSARYFLPPYEWYNDTISRWASEWGLQLVNYTPGTLSHADYTTPRDKNYRGSEEIYRSIVAYEKAQASGMNGFILLMHIGTDPKRKDKLYYRLPELIQWLREKKYQLVRIDELLK